MAGKDTNTPPPPGVAAAPSSTPQPPAGPAQRDAGWPSKEDFGPAKPSPAPKDRPGATDAAGVPPGTEPPQVKPLPTAGTEPVQQPEPGSADAGASDRAKGPDPKVSPPGERAAPAADYYSIIVNAISRLQNSTPETRKEVYDHARQVVGQRLQAAVPPTPSHVIALEELSLDRAIQKIEAEQLAKPSAEAAAPETKQQKAKAPAVAAPRRAKGRQKPSQIRGVVVRVFLVVGLITAGLVGYWLSIGRPNLMELRNAARESLTSEPKPEANEAPVAAAPTTTQPAGSQENAAAATDADAAAASNAAALEQYETQLDSVFAICRRTPDDDPCGNLHAPPPDLNVPGMLPSWVSTNVSLLRVRTPGKIQWPAATGPSPLQLADTSPATAAAEAKAGTTNSAAQAKFDSGKARAQSNDLDGAIADFTEAVRLDPKYADAWVERGQAFFKSGNADRAVADFNQALQADPRNVGAYKSRGMAMLYKNDSDSALIDLTRAIQFADMAPGTVPAIEMFYARRSRAALYDRKQLYDREIFDLTTMIDGFWKNPELAATLKTTYGEPGTSALIASLYKLRSGAHLRRRSIDSAVGDLSLAMQLDPSHSLQYLIERARIQEGAGRRDQAASDYKQALDLNPKSDEIKAALARVKAR